MFQRIKNFFYQRKIDKAVSEAVKETVKEKKQPSMTPDLLTKRCPRC